MSTNDLWFTARGAGLAALLILTVATTLGALGSTRVPSVGVRVIVQYVHRTAAVLGLALVVVHVSSLVLDSKSHVSLAGAVIPFAAHYRPSAVAFGSIATYTFLFVSALGLARGRLASSRVGAASWRGLHLLAYPAWAVAVAHGLLAGTDRTQNWVVLLNLGCVAAVLIAVFCRVAGLADEDSADIPPTSVRGLAGVRR